METYGYGTGRRYSQPRTDEERSRQHQQQYGSSKLPPRGMGLGIGNLTSILNPIAAIDMRYVIAIGAVVGAVAAYMLMKRMGK